MKIKIKWVATALAAILAGVVVTVYAVLASLDFDDLRGAIEAQAKAATGRSLKIAGPMNLEVSLSPTLTIEKVTFGNAEWGTWPELFSVRRLEVEVELLSLLSGVIQVRRLIAIEPTVLLETNLRGQGNWIVAGADTQTGGTTTIPAFRRIEISDGSAIFRDGRSGQEFLIKLESLKAWAETPASPSKVSLKANYNGFEFGAGGTLGSRDALLGGGRFPVDLEIEARDILLKAKGSIGDLAAFQGLVMDIDMRGQSLSGLGLLIGEDLTSLGPYILTGHLSDTGSGIGIEKFSLSLGDSKLAGDAELLFAGERPKITANLKSDTLDIDDFIGSDGGGGEPGDDPESGGIFSGQPLPVTALQTIDVFGTLSAGQVRFDDKTMMSDLSLVIDLEKGRLDLTDIQAGFSGGLLSGALSYDTVPADPPLSFDLRASGFDYGHFLQGRDITGGVDGKLDAVAKLNATGKSMRDWAGSLNGRIDITGGEGRIRSELLGASGAGLSDVFSAWREGDDDLQLNCVVMRLPIEKGVVKTEAVLIDTAAVTVGVSGEVKLGEESLDLKVTPQAKHTSLMSLAVPLRVTGPILEPSVGPDAIGTVLGMAKIAGMVLNPLVAGAVIVLESEISDKNPCVAALDPEGAAKARSQPKDDNEPVTPRDN